MDNNLWQTNALRLSEIQTTSGLNASGDTVKFQQMLNNINSKIDSGLPVLKDGQARQDVTFNIISNERQRLANKKASVDNAYESTQRMVQLNNNYQKRYWDYTKIIIIWIGVLALYLSMNLLTQYVPAIPSILTDILVLIALVVGAIYSFIIYNTLRNYDLMNYGQINPAAPVVNPDQAAKNQAKLKNKQTIGDYVITSDPNELNCLKNNLFYNTDSNNVTKCYKTCSAPDGTSFGKCTTPGDSNSPVTIDGFQNIQASGEYEFSDYAKV